jgi:transcriptional regulator GlxA family with amidase domain
LGEKNVLLFLLGDFADWEAGYVSAELNSTEEKNPYRIRTVGLDGHPVRSIGGLTVLPDHSLSDVPEDFEALLLIGGTGWRAVEAERVVPLVESALERGRLVGGICDASWFLARHGFLNDVAHTSNSLQDLRGLPPEHYRNEDGYRVEPAVIDGNVVTANGTAPLEFARLVFRRLALDSDAAIEEWYEINKSGWTEFAKKRGLEA